ncbi:MAG TPA: ABC transporter permease, partial [Clostridia bacterium]|nr:ABC transporter permease [Clostridia bacterium]
MKGLTFREALRYLIAGAGIAAGVFVLVSVLVLIGGGKAIMRENFWNKGVKVYDIELPKGSRDSGEYLQQEDGSRLREKMPQVRGSIPVLKAAARLVSYRKEKTVDTLGVNEGYLEYANLQMLRGSFITEKDVKAANKVALLDDLTALELFGTTDIKGQKLDIQVAGSSEEFIVAGVFRNFGKNIETIFEEDIPGTCIIPCSVPAEEGLDFEMEKLIVLVDDELHPEKAAAVLGRLLEREHGAAGLYEVEEYEQLPEVSRFSDKYLFFAVAAGLIGVISGGIGVMNAMLLLLRERRREIGIYRFFGAGIKRLRHEIIYRSLVIGLCSGGLGLVSGVLAGGLLGSMFNLSLSLPAESIFIAAAASTAAGIISGLYPASLVGRVDVSAAIWDE